MVTLGIDAGGTQTRWALAGTDGTIIADGFVAGMSATQMASPAGRDAVRGVLAELAQQVLAAAAPVRVCAGLTGFDGVAVEPAQWLAAALGLAPTAVTVRSDIEIAYLASFKPGAGYLVYAGTGSIAAWIDADGVFHRAGGRGVTLDDGGGGFWIAREAMRLIWRREDEQPGAWEQSPLARAVFDHVGGSDWACSRQFIYGQDRGAVGRLALAVASVADADPQALAILEQAGRELARIALALVGRYGPRPIAVAGRAATLHPAIMTALRQALPATLPLTRISIPAHHAAARIALHSHA
jgi:N-acetylglucosamine kinase-like BadF-type ATPase